MSDLFSPGWCMLLGVAVVMVGKVILAIMHYMAGVDEDSVRATRHTLRLYLYGTALSAMALWFFLSPTPFASRALNENLRDVSGIDTPEKLLAVLREQDRAMAQTREAVHWFLFLFFISLCSMSEILPRSLDKLDRSKPPRVDMGT